MQHPIVRALWIAPVLAVGAGAPNAIAQDAAPTLPPITVTAEMLKRRIDTYVSAISGGYVHSDDRPMARWRDAVCPVVAGLPHDDGQFVFDRFSDDLSSNDVALGKVGCHPNFFMVATVDPEATLRSWWHHDFHLNGGRTGFTQFVGTPRPVRIWYNAKLIAGDGSPASSDLIPGIDAFHGGPSPQVNFVAVPDLSSVIVVIDLRRVGGMDWRQVTDYIAMAGVTKISLDAHVQSAPTIMSLFSAAADARPQGLSAWDKSFIKELYSTDTVYRHQREAIAKGIFNDVAATTLEHK